MTQIELSKELDVNPNTVSRWENESIPAIPKTVELSLEALECREKFSKNKENF